MGGIDRIIKKMTSIVDGNEIVVKSNSNLTDKNHVEAALKNGTDLYTDAENPEKKFYPCDISEINLPYLAEFVKKYPHFIKIEGSF